MTIRFNQIEHSSINLVLKIRRLAFSVDRLWLYSLRRIYYGPEMKAKYISELHQNHKFEQEYLQDILNFSDYINRGVYIINRANQDLDNFIKEYKSFNAVIAADSLKIKNVNHPVITNGDTLAEEQNGIIDQLKYNLNMFGSQGYKVLENIEKLRPIKFNAAKPLPHHFSYKDIFDNSPVSNQFMLREFVNAYNVTQSSLNEVNRWINDIVKNRNHKIIAGIAGTGKSHTIGYLIQEIDKRGDYTIFLNARSFDGDAIEFSRRFHNRLFIPEGYSLLDTLKRLNKFAKKKGRRLFIIFDALNETTTSTFGFSPIWGSELQNLINLVSGFSHLYFICTLRTSYIEEIWSIVPENIATLKGIPRFDDTLQMCKRYFDYYKIDAANLDTADLSIFTIPLLLDLFCKMINVDRAKQKTINLDGHTYHQIFESYIEQLVKDVTKRRNLVAKAAVYEGLHNCSGGFMQNIEATLPLKEFISSFDPAGHMVSKDKSIAQPMLEGNLVFIKEQNAPRREIVKHTQQLIGGYLLAQYLIDEYSQDAQLLASPEFLEKIVGNDPALRHQLRLDVLKFLVIMRPELINAVTEKTAFQEGWWYLYNGYDGNLPRLPNQLLANPLSLQISWYVFQISMIRWLDPDHAYNFKFIVRYLAQFDSWTSDINWAHYIYDNADLFFDFVESSTQNLVAEDIREDKELLSALLIALLTASTIRELRDRATVYLVRYGVRFPRELLDIAKLVVTQKDSYIYQRVIHAMYGAALTKQHDPNFIQDHLPTIAETIFRFQFAADAIHPIYDYIVIDSIKHLLDLAVYKGAWTASAEDLGHISRYSVRSLPEWISPSDEMKRQVAESDERNPPDPIRMDFAIYTIPRLIESGGYDLRPIAVANVLKRIYELGFKGEEDVPLHDGRFRSFYLGNNTRRNVKVDRLGKKYNWKAYFDYAGYLLQQGNLDVYKTFGDPSSGYNRLVDVEIDISLPECNYTISECFFNELLIPEGNRPVGWQMETKIEAIEPQLVREFHGVEYVMLKGVVEQRIDQGYEVRSFIMVESCFIKKSKDFERLKNEICPQIFNWNGDLNLSPEYDSGVYFGEYYWGDNQVAGDIEYYSVKTGRKIIKKRIIGPRDLFNDIFGFKSEDVGKEVDFTEEEFIIFKGEPTLIQYLNESRSKSFDGFSMYIPAVRMGKYLGLKAAPISGLILDSELHPCLITVDYEHELIKNEATYMRSDLLKKYLNDHGYALMYQNKQHSYDIDSSHNRSMKYVVWEGDN